MVDGPPRARLPIPPTATLSSCLRPSKDLPISPPVLALRFFFAMQVQHSSTKTRQPMVEFYLLTVLTLYATDAGIKNHVLTRIDLTTSALLLIAGCLKKNQNASRPSELKLFKEKSERI